MPPDKVDKDLLGLCLPCGDERNNFWGGQQDYANPSISDAIRMMASREYLQFNVESETRWVPSFPI